MEGDTWTAYGILILVTIAIVGLEIMYLVFGKPRR